MKKTIIALTASLFAMLSPAQNLISSGSPLYKLPYKNTYVMQTLVAENTFRTAKVEKPKPGSFEQAKKVMDECESVICCRDSFGSLEQLNAKMVEYAMQTHKLGMKS